MTSLGRLSLCAAFTLVGLILIEPGAPALAADPEPIEALVLRLGSEDFGERDAASTSFAFVALSGRSREMTVLDQHALFPVSL